MTSTPPDSESLPELTDARTSRRDFLLDAGHMVGVAALTAPLALLTGYQQTAMAHVSKGSAVRPNWDQLERNLSGNLLRPDGAAYAEAIKIWNLRYASTRPAGVAMVANSKDIATAIAWARDNQVDLITRSGGHSYAGYSTTPGLVINLNDMTKVTLDRATGNLTTFGAAKNKDVAAAGRLHGRALPGGQCPTVGISGFVLGGGLGFHMRQHGMGIDSLLSTEMVTAEGECLQVSDKEYPDLFWALRGGGGGNFGVNTSFTFRTFPVPEQATVFSLSWEGDACVQAFLAFQDVLLGAPNALGAIAEFSASRGRQGAVIPKFEIMGQIIGQKDAADKLFAPVIAVAKPKTTLIETLSFWDAKSWLSEESNAPKPFAERSRFHPKPLTEDGVAAILDALAKVPILGSKQHVESSFFAWGGAVAEVPATATAFVHRNDLWLQTFNCSWGPNDPQPEIDRLMAWQNDFYNAMKPFASDRAFQNFADPQLEQPLQSYYGENLKRLIDVKKKYDRNEVFTFAQSIKG